MIFFLQDPSYECPCVPYYPERLVHAVGGNCLAGKYDQDQNFTEKKQVIVCLGQNELHTAIDECYYLEDGEWKLWACSLVKYQ